MKKLAIGSMTLLALFVGVGCGSSATEQRQGQERKNVALIDYDRMRDKVLLGLAKDFRASAVARPGRYGLCVRLGMRRALTPRQLDRLAAIHRQPDGRQLAAQALNALASPIGAKCGGARFVPELITASKPLGADYPLGRRGVAARRLGVTYGPFLGVTCRRTGLANCDSVGVDVVLRRDARAVTALVGGRKLLLSTPGEHTGRAGRDWIGFLDRVGLRRPSSPFRIPTNGRGAASWAGSPPVYLPVRLEIAYPDGTTAAGILPRVILRPGWG